MSNRKTVVLVGHCGPDGGYLRMAISGAVKGATVIVAEDESSLNNLLTQGVDLVLINRQLDYGFGTNEGVELVAQLRAKAPKLKMMLVSNYQEAQQAAMQAGAIEGFGKREIGSARVKQLLREALAGEGDATVQS